ITTLPINPATGKVWTQTDWLRQTTKLASAVKTSLAPRVVVGNGLQMGSRYFASTAPTGVLVNASTRGLIPEAWVRAATQSLTSYRALTAWQQDVNMLRDSGSKGVGVFTITKTWASGTQAQKDALYKYALASYLLGNDGTAWFFFSYNNVANDSTVRLPHNYDDYGPAKGAYYLAQNVYQRDFSKGKALVNP